ncbi:hypothetical protein GCM10010232_70780 [Streptomyces amakusaensis]
MTAACPPRAITPGAGGEPGTLPGPQKPEETEMAQDYEVTVERAEETDVPADAPVIDAVVVSPQEPQAR